MLPLRQNMLLQRVAEVKMVLHSRGDFTVRYLDQAVHCHQHAPNILTAFNTPHTVQHVVQQLQAQVTNTQEWIDLTVDIQQLYKVGILCEAHRISLKAPMRSFDMPVIHIKMLNDTKRTLTYQKAIQEVVRPGDVVVEIGTGTGILAMLAAQAGAKHVYAIEAGRIGDIAEANFAANGFADKITLLRGLSTGVTVPELGDVLLSEIIGNDPFDEGVMKFTRDAQQRLLKPNARLLPHQVRLYALPVQLEDNFYNRYIPSKHDITEWQKLYNVDLSAFANFTPNGTFRISLDDKCLKWQTSTEPILLIDANLKDSRNAKASGCRSVTISADIEINGVLTYFEIGLGEQILSQHPAQIDATNSWQQLLWLLPEPILVRKGDILEICDTRDKPLKVNVTSA